MPAIVVVQAAEYWMADDLTVVRQRLSRAGDRLRDALMRSGKVGVAVYSFTVRSRQVSAGRFVRRCSTINCWHKRAPKRSGINSDLLRARSRVQDSVWDCHVVVRLGPLTKMAF